MLFNILSNSYQPNFKNVSYAKQCGLRSMQNIKGVEREIIEAYRSELTHDIWGDPEKLKQWAFKKIEEIATYDYPSKLLDNITIREGRTDAVDRWYQIIKENPIIKNNPFFQLKIIKFVTEKLQPNNKQLAPIINPKVITDTIGEIKKTGGSFKKTYYKNMRDFDSSSWLQTEEISENGVLGKWYTINVPDTNNAKRNLKQFQEIKNFIAILSQGSNWCTRSPYTVGREYNNCLFNIFIDNKGVPQVCMSSMGKNKNWFEYIRGNNQYTPIQEKFKQIIKSFLDRHNIKNGVVGKVGNEEPIQSFLG